jgi:hypothetical protein
MRSSSATAGDLVVEGSLAANPAPCCAARGIPPIAAGFRRLCRAGQVRSHTLRRITANSVACSVLAGYVAGGELSDPET